MSKDCVVLDVETGGLDSKRHSLLTVGIVLVKDDVALEQGEFKIKHNEYCVTAKALKINKIDLVKHHEDADAITLEQAKETLTTFVKNVFGEEKPEVVGHNVAFGIGFVRDQIFGSKEEMDKTFSYRSIDTAGISRFLTEAGIISPRNNSLDGLIEYFGVGSSEDSDRHTALGDALKTLEVYKKLVEVVKGATNE